MADVKKMTEARANRIVHFIGIAGLTVAFAMLALAIWPCHWTGQPSLGDAGQALILAMTLYALLFYVRDTWRIADLQEQELGLRKMPVVSLYSRRPIIGERDRTGEFWTRIGNLSNVHAIARFEASLLSKDRKTWEPLSEIHPEKDNYAYSGRCTWSLQAGTNFLGNLDLPDVLDTKNVDELFNRLACSQIRIRSWVAPYPGKSPARPTEWIENPPQYFIWVRRRGRWEPHPPGASFDKSSQVHVSSSNTNGGSTS